MKKFLFSFLFLMSVLGVHAENVFSKYNQSTSFGLHFGAVDQQNNMGLQILMFHFSVYGVYADFGGWPRSHANDTRIDKWDDECAMIFHFGYQIPITSWLKITPLIGHYSHKYGETNGYDWTCSNNEIVNKFNVDYKTEGIDYGANIMFHIPVGRSYNTKFDLQLGGTYTKNTWYAGIGLNINFHK